MGPKRSAHGCCHLLNKLSLGSLYVCGVPLARSLCKCVQFRACSDESDCCNWSSVHMASVSFLCCISCLFLCHVGASALQLFGAPGEEVGSSVREANAQVAAEANQNRGRSDFQTSYTETLTAKETVLVNPAVSKVIEQTNRLASTLVARDGLCERRWSAKCPDGWRLTGLDLCAAPASYGGACKTLQTFAGKTVSEKQQIADECKAPWPCQDDCHMGHEYSDACPKGWNDDGGAFCRAPLGFVTKCATLFNFAEMDIKTKQELGLTCGFSWECQSGCEQDFSQPCPQDWTEVLMNPGICTAPTTYPGTCSFSINTTHMTALQKHAFGQKCAVRFPCLSATATSETVAASAQQRLMPDGPIDLQGEIAPVLQTRLLHEEISTEANTRSTERMFRLHAGPLRRDTI